MTRAAPLLESPPAVCSTKMEAAKLPGKLSDDNAAPVRELLPAWKRAEKAWTALAGGDHDRTQSGMEFWPDRAKQACQTKKSFAIAYGLA